MAKQTANEVYRDSAIRHAVYLRRYSAGVLRKIADLLEKADADLADQLRKKLPALATGAAPDFTGDKYKQLIADIKALRSGAMKSYRDLADAELKPLPKAEMDTEVQLLKAAIPMEVTFAEVSVDQLAAIVTSKPFHGKLLKEWYSTVQAADQSRIQQALQIGLAGGETTDDIVRRVIGTRANKYADGIVAATRRDAQAIVRTAVNHVSNEAREALWDENDDIITAKIWHATLDGRTTAICRARDGAMAPVGNGKLPKGAILLSPPNATPPAHISCRSIMVAYIDGIGLVGDRPFVRDTRTRDARETDFAAEAKKSGRTIKEVRADWAEQNIGRVPASTNYQDFLKRQPVGFQNDVLGETKGTLFRKGGLTVQDFVDKNGAELTLPQLAKVHSDAFRRAGLDPSQF